MFPLSLDEVDGAGEALKMSMVEAGAEGGPSKSSKSTLGTEAAGGTLGESATGLGDAPEARLGDAPEARLGDAGTLGEPGFVANAARFSLNA